MTVSNIYKDITITSGEFIQVLFKLHYRKETEGNYYRFVNDKFNSIVIIPIQPLNEPVPKVHLVTYTFRLTLQGVIKNEEDIIKIVEKNRLTRKVHVS